MSLFRKKIRRTAIAGLSLTLCATLTASCAMINIENKPKVPSSEVKDVQFTDVTDKYDTSGLIAQNFNSAVLPGEKSYETRTVIVYLNGESVLDSMSESQTVADYLSTNEGRSQLRSIDREQRTFLNKLDSQGINYKLKSSYTTIANAVAVEINTSYVKRIKNMGGVSSAVLSNTYLAPQTYETAQSVSLPTNDANVYPTGIYDSSIVSNESWGKGEGMVVAILDTGLDYTHNAFQTIPNVQSMSVNDVSAVLAQTEAFKRTAALGGTLTADSLYVSGKVPFAFDYADNDTDVYPSYSNHGTHVAGIVGGYDEDGYDDKEGTHIDETFKGVAPQAQLVICKTFTDNLDDSALGGAESENIMSALEDCVTLGVDVINMSLGSTAGFTTTDDGDDEGEHFNKIFESIRERGISLICAASNDYSAGFGSIYGTNLATNPDSGTVGSPSTYFAALSVASISGQESEYLEASNGKAIFIENSTNGNGVFYNFVDEILGGEEEKEVEYVVVGSGQQSNYTGVAGELVKGRIALVKRGINTFQEKVEIAIAAGAIGVIIWNNVSGTIRMSLGDIPESKLKPTASVTMDAGNELVRLASSGQSGIVGTLKVKKDNAAGPFMSAFSSWGTTNDLRIKPEITAHGGEITSTVPGGYAEQSGTSMASPNMAGLTALVRNYIVNSNDLRPYITDNGTVSGNIVQSKVTQLANQLVMSTATTVYDEANLAYSPRKQGSGLASLKNIVNTKAYLFTDEESDGELYYEGKDCRPKIELGADEAEKGEYTFSFKIKNFGSDVLNFTPQSIFMTEEIDSTGIAVAEKAHMLNDNAAFKVDGNTVTDKISVGAGETKLITVTLKLTDLEKAYIRENFKNGMFVEGFIKLVGEQDENGNGQCDLNVPFLSFFGDWTKAPMLDYTAFEIAENQQDSSVLEEEKIKETVWATQPYGAYNGDNFIIPLGSYVYTLPDGADKMYANEEYCAISRFNEIISDDGRGNYATVYEIRCVYAGLLRNAQKVNYKLYDAYTGELVYTDVNYRISKAYANGGSSRPAYVELKLDAEELGLKSNGKYRFDFEFLFNKDDTPKEENTYSFEFYVDYEAPVLRDARLRYYNTTDEQGRDAQRIYLDLDIFDNHYPQSVMLCYVDNDGEKQEMKLATDYATPVRNANRNDVTTVSVEVTDIWDDYKDILAVQIDDYALNHSSYLLNSLSSAGQIETTVNRGTLPDTFELAAGEENITLNINQMHKASLVYEGNADLSNFEWSSPSHYVAVKNGEIVGLESTNGKSYPVLVNNRKGVSKVINVTVTDTVTNIRGLSFGFGTIKNTNEALQKAEGTVSVYAGEDIQLEVEASPWYFNGETKITWKVDNPVGEVVATVDQSGKVHTKKRGTAVITAQIEANGTGYVSVVTLSVQDEFTVSNMSLTRYRGEGETYTNPKGEVEENVVIVPSSKQIMTIGEGAFEDNDKIKKIIIPKTITQIEKNAFKGCTALEKVYFMSDDEAEYDKDKNPSFVADADLSLINRNAFEGCTNLELLDLRYTKVFTLGREVFKDCVSLKTIVKSKAIGTAYDRAFMGCSSLETIDISGMHVAGANVFSGCTSLKNVTTKEFTAIGNGMFASLRYIYPDYSYVTGEWETKQTDYAACTSLESITLNGSSVGNGAFENCEKLSTVNFGNGVKTIGERAFANTALTSVTLPDGLESIGAGAFDGTSAFSAAGGITVTNNAVIKGDTLINYFGNASSLDLSVFGVTTIAPYAFANNSSLQSVTVPASINEIGEGAFSGCKNLTTVNFVSGNTINYIAPYAFYDTGITSVTLPNTVTEIGDYAFALSKITSFNFVPQSYAIFGNGVFYNCSELAQIELNEKITVMGDATFADCSSLYNVKMPAVTSLGANTFYRTPALAKVEFAADAKVTGTYTFAADDVSGRQKLTQVILGNSVEEIGAYAFYNCANLTEINLNFDANGARTIGDYAFYNNRKLALVNGLSQAEKVGAYAFTNCNALKSLNLTNAKEIGDGAFRIIEGKAYTSVEIPAAEKIGAFAFCGGNEKTLVIPASLKEVGIGAFGASSSLKEFKIEEGNKVFFVNDGVLYRNINDGNKDTGLYGLVAYPSEKVSDVYTVLENTARIEGGAFFGMHAKINKVVMPYSLKSVGAMAFFQSGITDYEFKGVTAPALETEYSLIVNNFAEANNINFRGYYYANFENYFIYYSELGTGVSVTPLSISYPVNGTGYDNNIYSQYFANRNHTQTALDANAYAFVNFLENCPSVSEISAWKEPEKTKAEVEEFAALVKCAHEYYDNFSSDSAQVALVGNERIELFNQIEAVMREVKPRFGISVRVVRLKASGDYRTEYRAGEKFDMTGLKVILVYDDYSTAEADMSQIKLEYPTEALQELDVEVVLSGYGRQLSIRVYVTENGGSGSGCTAGCGSVDTMGGTMFLTITGVGVLLAAYAIFRRKSRGCK